jgi:hypothetical protein
VENLKVRVLVEWGTVENLKRLLVFCAAHIDHAQVDHAQALMTQFSMDHDLRDSAQLCDPAGVLIEC